MSAGTHTVVSSETNLTKECHLPVGGETYGTISAVSGEIGRTVPSVKGVFNEPMRPSPAENVKCSIYPVLNNQQVVRFVFTCIKIYSIIKVLHFIRSIIFIQEAKDFPSDSSNQLYSVVSTGIVISSLFVSFAS